MQDGKKCKENLDCLSCNWESGAAICLDGHCVSKHSTAVGGVIAAIAPEADLFMANADNMSPVTIGAIEHAYKYLVDEQKVPIVNESFATTRAFVHGIVEDELARSRGLFVTVASGNEAAYEWGAPACRDSTNALCVGAHGAGLQLSCFSNWGNPGPADGSEFSDREEPDLLGFGGEGGVDLGCPASIPEEPVRVAEPGTTGYTTARGTSFSAPAAAASAALLLQYCREMGNWIPSGLWLRSVLMAAAMRNSIQTFTPNFRYSTSRLWDDWKDGAGILSLGVALTACNPELADEGEIPIIASEGEIDVNRGEKMPGDGDWKPPLEPPENPRAGADGAIRPFNQHKQPGPDDGRVSQRLYYIGKLSKYGRVRAVFSWNTCRQPGDLFSRPTPDFDLFLYNVTKNRIVFTSQSFDDNNEGFDVDVATLGEDGDEYELIVGWLKNYLADNMECPDTKGIEPYAVSLWIKR